jgi:preprotein translocase subunit SecG
LPNISADEIFGVFKDFRKIRHNFTKVIKFIKRGMEKTNHLKKPLFSKLLIAACLMLIVDASIFLYSAKGNFTGYSVSEISLGLSKSYGEVSLLSKAILLLQWVFMGLFLLIAFLRERQVLVKEQEIVEEKKPVGRALTDLDILYTILKEKKRLKLSTIVKTFKVTSEVALNWCKILEAGNLAVIDYPGIGEPEIKYVEKPEDKK